MDQVPKQARASNLEQVRLDTQGFDLPVRRMIAIVPSPSAVASTISAPQTTFRGVVAIRNQPLKLGPVLRAAINAGVVPHRRNLTDSMDFGNYLLVTEH